MTGALMRTDISGTSPVPLSVASSNGVVNIRTNSQVASSATVGAINPENLTGSPPASVGKSSLVALDVSRKLDVTVQIDGYLTSVFGALLVVGLAYRFWRLQSGRASDFEINEAEFGLGQQKIKLKANDDDRQIAYKIWVELSTRKIGLKIDLEQDVISEVYDSWHTYFSVTRELIKDVPVRKYRRDATAKIVQLSIEVLNEGLRPHLTRWQARFRRWYERAALHADFESQSPQEIQRAFPAFEELSKDLMLVNGRLIAYRAKMHELISQR